MSDGSESRQSFARPRQHAESMHCWRSAIKRGSSMIWLEMISTRAAGISEAGKILEICRQMHQSIAGEKLLKMTVFCNTRYETDISIHLQWRSNPGTGSVLGRELSSALADLGLIRHSLWIEQEEPLLQEGHNSEQQQPMSPLSWDGGGG
jgi:hypothetical protein